MKDLSLRTLPLVAALPAPSALLAGAIVRLATDNQPYWCDGLTWQAMTASGVTDARIGVTRLSADASVSSTTLANVAGLSIPLQADATYAVSAYVMFQTAATTTGARFTQTIPAGATVVAQWNIAITTTTRGLSNQRASDAGGTTTSIDTANANTLTTAELLVVTAGAPGDLQIRCASEVAGSAVTVKAGSCLIATKVA